MIFIRLPIKSALTPRYFTVLGNARIETYIQRSQKMVDPVVIPNLVAPQAPSNKLNLFKQILRGGRGPKYQTVRKITPT